MLIGLMKDLAFVYEWTWFIWPLVLLAALAEGTLIIVREQRISKPHLLVAALALTLILCGVTAPLLRL